MRAIRVPEARGPHRECPRAGSVEGRMQLLRACLLGSSLLAFIACTVETKTVAAPPANEPASEPVAEEEETEPVADAGKSDATTKKDAAADAAPKKAEW